MCVDPITATFLASSALSAGAQIMQGNAANASARMEARQYETRRKQIEIETSAAIRERMRVAEDALSTNKLAIGFSGLSGAGFAPMLAGNEALVRQDLAAIDQDGRARGAEMGVAAAGARADGKAARRASFVNAGATILQSALSYEQNRGFRPNGESSLPSLFRPGTWRS